MPDFYTQIFNQKLKELLDNTPHAHILFNLCNQHKVYASQISASKFKQQVSNLILYLLALVKALVLAKYGLK